ncbi:multidrug efflux pump subunit AcrA (membrane-fusion protein) [Micromonospora pisi]|uniref:Multidrug efflux pump subunit AcrA (Membrane-fusion protein) n=1 Tax=Micromonospora pisi TaxID=589240 RepID=A0A495JN86_9ACTN|nr:peptidoglycan-binding protein [Micromonospora pisi]RKR89489.1 multidrug efflux pump subunit AcrA (membrane-fusion protein) [Micromonospora pisi]
MTADQTLEPAPLMPAPAAVPQPRESKRQRRSRTGTVLVTAAVVVTVGAGGAAAVGFGGRDPGTATAAPLPPATAQVTRQTLVDAQTVDGKLGYGTARTVTARRNGTLTWLAPTGGTVKRGGALYAVDNAKVVLLHGGLPAYRTLASGVEGADVRQFEQNLAALGYDGFTVDDEYTANTAEAVRDWQEDLGRDETGTVEPTSIVYADGDVRVEGHEAATGDLTQPGKSLMTYSGTNRLVTVELEVDDQRLAKKDATVGLTLPDGKQLTGTIAGTETVIETSGGGAGGQTEAETKIEVTVSVADPAALVGFDQATVRVAFTAAERPDVLTVPVAALLALAEGGYGVQIVDADRTRIVAVRTGLFASGRVEVSGDGLAEGLTVGVPA